jgi:hypothetical protein
MCVLIFSTICAKHFSLKDEFSEMHIGLHVKCPLFLSDFHTA